MNSRLEDRLDQILPRITSPEFLSGEGIGNEVACYIFDYPPEDELQARAHVERMTARLASRHQGLDVLSLNLLDVVLAYLDKRGLLAKTLALQQKKGDAAVLRALRGPLAAEKICSFIAETHRPAERDLILLTGVGGVWPMLRAHRLLNGLHAVLEQTPLVMFYPGRFDGTTLRLFDRIESSPHSPGGKPYYRAFILVPGGSET